MISPKEKKGEEMGFSGECSPKTVHYPAYYLGIDLSSWTSLIKSEFLNMTGLVWLVCSSAGVKVTKICLFWLLIFYLQWIFMVLFKTIIKMKSLQQFFGSFYHTDLTI